MVEKQESVANRKELNPGDEAAPGTPGTGEVTCPVCHGGGRIQGRACEHCGGSGRVIKAIGGA
jgi:RecJ-like exonuclease